MEWVHLAWTGCKRKVQPLTGTANVFTFVLVLSPRKVKEVGAIAVICVTKSRTGDYDFRACARARGFRGSTFSVGRIRFAVCAERSRDKTCVF